MTPLTEPAVAKYVASLCSSDSNPEVQGSPIPIPWSLSLSKRPCFQGSHMLGYAQLEHSLVAEPVEAAVQVKRMWSVP